MASGFALRGIGLLTLCCLLTGCGYFQGNSADDDNEFADLELEDDADRVLKVPKPDRSSSKEPAAITADAEPLQGDLGLRLAVGDRFPLQKTVEQRLTQPNEEGDSTGHSRLDLLLSLTVEELRAGQIRFGVRYHRVRYLEQDPAGRTSEYNSMAPARDVPAQARVYAGLVDNGFSFWIGPDNRLIDLVGFADFVQRCVRDVPPQSRQAVMEQLAAGKGENGIASFIDDSIGLLPVSPDPQSSRVAVQEGMSWKLPVRKIDGPIPMLVETQCKIKGLSEQTAEIDLFGSVAPTNQVNHAEGWKVSVLGGRCQGSCTVDRSTGLPTDSRVERYIDLLMELPDGTQLKQRKEIVTTIHAFLSQDGASPAAAGVRPASHAEDFPPAATETESSAKKSRLGNIERPLFR